MTMVMFTSAAIVLGDVKVSDLQFDALWMIGFTCLGLLVASLRFSKRLD